MQKLTTLDNLILFKKVIFHFDPLVLVKPIHTRRRGYETNRLEERNNPKIIIKDSFI